MPRPTLPTALAALAALGLAQPAPAGAQAGFEGVIVSRLFADGRPMDLTTSLRGTRSRMEMSSGPGAGMGYQLFDGDRGTMTMVIPEQRMYMVMDLAEAAGEAQARAGRDTGPLPDIRATGRTETIAGHTCEHYVVAADGEQWDICAAKGLGFMGAFGGNPMAGGRGGLSVPVRHRQLYETFKDGFQPLRMERLADGRRELLMEVVSIDRKSLPAGHFEVPEGFRKMDMGGLMGRMPRVPRPPR